MKKLFHVCVLMIGLQVQAQVCPVIPMPKEAIYLDAAFAVDKNTPIYVQSPRFKGVAQYIQQEFLRLKGLPLAIKSNLGKMPTIKLEQIKGLPEEAYELAIGNEGIVIKASDEAGAFNGASSLAQLFSLAAPSSSGWAIAAWNIKDQPRYAWRGLMLDESRYFIGKDKLKSLIDWMAFYKLNKLHWHLTDEPAWRIEIKKYPKLSLVGGVGDYNDPKRPAAYYTQSEISEIVDYAARRNIAIIPEIDMPGHATAANMAYPQYSGGGNAQHPEFTFDPGNPDTYAYLSNILREVNALFPSGMLHLGGDEVSFGTDKWQSNEGIKKLQQEHGLQDLKAVEHYFMERMADSVYQLDAKLMAWDEMADINLPKDETIIFWWRHDKPEQLQTTLDKGYQTVLCPRLPYYFDFVQDSGHHAGRKWGGLYNSLQDVYVFSVDKWVRASQQTQILGIQANLWTETVTNTNRLDYLLFPRLAALAEAAWSSESEKDYKVFEERLKPHLRLYRDQNIYFYNPFNPNEIPEPVYFKRDRKDLNAMQN
ncbi:beta-N-acetylhexosaminidase [Olivibacter sitiensis]|uniref:beta-N-acetylhexosaminidase n=1 Tax=Olivibacter sitiensis TaxID=376470 RepID=UPI00041214D5|nr:beta-N-acetylhexosaminidase [Olivibacter sitiensis]